MVMGLGIFSGMASDSGFCRVDCWSRSDCFDKCYQEGIVKYYIKISMPVSATERRPIPAEFDSAAERYWFAEKAARAGFPVVEFGQYSRTRKAVEVFEEADEGFLSEYAEFIEAVG